MNNFHDKPIIFEKLLSKFLTLTEREKLTDVIFNFFFGVIYNFLYENLKKNFYS